LKAGLCGGRGRLLPPILSRYQTVFTFPVGAGPLDTITALGDALLGLMMADTTTPSDIGVECDTSADTVTFPDAISDEAGPVFRTL